MTCNVTDKLTVPLTQITPREVSTGLSTRKAPGFKHNSFSHWREGGSTTDPEQGAELG